MPSRRRKQTLAQSGLRRRSLLGIGVCAVIAGAPAAPVLAASTPPAAASSGPTYGVRAALSGKTTLNHNHFAYALPAGGASVGDAVVVSNFTAEPLSFAVHGADMVAATGGGVAPAAEGAQPHQVGAWMAVAQPSITVPPGREVSDPFTVTVPDAQPAGEFLGAVVVAETSTDAGGVHLLTRAALIVDVTVLPSVRLVAAAGPLQGAQQHDGEHFSVDVDNTGNVLFTFTGEVTVRDGSGNAVATLPLGPGGLYVIPGGRATVTAVWSGLPLWGRAVATATIHARVTGGPSATAVSAPLELGFFPWALVLGVLAGLVAMLVALFLIRRRRQSAA